MLKEVKDTKIGACIQSIFYDRWTEAAEVAFHALPFVDQHCSLLEAEELVVLVFRVRHEFLESFRLMLVILRLFNRTDLHACLDYLQWLQDQATNQPAESSVNEPGKRVSLHYFLVQCLLYLSRGGIQVV